MDTNMTYTNDGIWLFALLILFGMGGNGFGFGGNGRNVATADDLNFSRLENQVRANADLTERKADAIVTGLCDGFYTTAQQINGVNMNVMESRYLNEKATADSTAQIIGAINGLSAKMDAEKMAEMREKITRLENEKLFCGIPRINPYGYGVYPYNNGCGCNAYNQF